MRTRTTTLTMLLGLALLSTACSVASTSDPEASYDLSDEAAQAPDSGDDEETDDAAGGSTTDGKANDVVTFGGTGAAVGRELARTASIIVEVADLEQAAAQVAAAAQRAGGFVSDANVRGGDFGYGLLTLRVPATSLDATIEDLADVGVQVIESSIATEDLTEQLTDIGARIANLEALETELQALLGDVRTNDPDVGQLLVVFDRLSQVRGDIERLQAQQSGAKDRVALATINVELVPTAIAPEPTEVEPVTTFGKAWASTTEAFKTIGDAFIWFAVTILPVGLVVLGVPALLLWLLVRRVNDRRNAAVAAMPTPPAPPAPQPVSVGAPDTSDGPEATEV